MELLVLLLLVAAANAQSIVCEGRQPGFYPDVYNCQNYIECDEKGEARRYSCPDGQWFDRVNIECTWSELLDCEAIPNPDEPPTCPANGTATLPWRGDCLRYYLCINGERFEMACGPKTEFDSEDSICRDEVKAKCNRCPLIDVPGTLVFLPNKANCQEYFLCRNFVQIPMTCDEGLHFNENNFYCEEPALAKCRVSLFYNKIS